MSETSFLFGSAGFNQALEAVRRIKEGLETLT
jgi:hypothetical protein